MEPYIIYAVITLILLIIGIGYLVVSTPIAGVIYVCCSILFCSITLTEYDDYKNRKDKK
jgi:hypothetical protein